MQVPPGYACPPGLEPLGDFQGVIGGGTVISMLGALLTRLKTAPGPPSRQVGVVTRAC